MYIRVFYTSYTKRHNPLDLLKKHSASPAEFGGVWCYRQTRACELVLCIIKTLPQCSSFGIQSSMSEFNKKWMALIHPKTRITSESINRILSLRDDMDLFQYTEDEFQKMKKDLCGDQVLSDDQFWAPESVFIILRARFHQGTRLDRSHIDYVCLPDLLKA